MKTVLKSSNVMFILPFVLALFMIAFAPTGGDLLGVEAGAFAAEEKWAPGFSPGWPFCYCPWAPPSCWCIFPD